MRINELAKELEIKSRMIIDFLPTDSTKEKRSHSSALDEEEVRKIREHFGQGGAGSQVKEKEKESPKTRAGVLEPLAEERQAAAPAPAFSRAPEPAPEKPKAPATEAPAGQPVRVESAPVARPSPAARMGSARVLRPPMRSSASPATWTPAAPPVYAAPPSPAPPQEIPQEAAHEPTVLPGIPGVDVPPAESLPVKPGLSGPARPWTLGSRTSLVSGSPAAGTVPPGTIIRPPGATPGLGTGPRPGAGKPIYQPRRGTTGPGVRPGGTSRVGVPPRMGAPMRSGVGAGTAVPGKPYERRPMHPTRTRPAAPGMPPPPGMLPPGPSRHRPRPSGPVRDRERGQKRMPPPLREPAEVAAPREINRSISITEGITVKDLAEKLAEKAKDLMQMLIRRGVLATINQPLESTLAIELARHFGAEAAVVSFEEQSQTEVQETEVQDPSKLVKRPPVVTIMGHVDHGKTSLLDAIRDTHVTDQEAGGITQHIGAYQVEIKGRKITFIDTPGHEAFTRMRARGSKVTDIVVLVVAADDGVMPQTLEAIDHARAAKVPIIVAVNKVDKPEALPERVKKQLADRGLMSEEWGGETVTVEVSAKQRKNIPLLLEMILLVADIQDLKANPDRPAAGTVLEARLDRGRGPVATVLVQNGTLRVGDPFIVGPVFSKVRALMDDHGRIVENAPPACPVEVLGLASLPQAGDQFQVITDVIKAKQTALYREQKLRDQQMASSSRVTLEQLHEQMKAGMVKELPIILKADVRGSAEVVAESLSKIFTDKVKVKIIHTGVGAITESDVLLAAASNAIIVGFNVRPERKAQEVAEQEKVDIRLHTIIYNLTDEVKKALTGLLEPTTREVSLGRAEVRQTFRISKVGAVAGCFVAEGRLARNAQARLVRDGAVVYTGKVGSLRRFKDDASEVRSGFECGVTLENFSDLKPGDVIEAFVIEKVQVALIQ